MIIAILTFNDNFDKARKEYSTHLYTYVQTHFGNIIILAFESGFQNTHMHTNIQGRKGKDQKMLFSNKNKFLLLDLRVLDSIQEISLMPKVKEKICKGICLEGYEHTQKTT